jgi:hypothetical protein
MKRRLIAAVAAAGLFAAVAAPAASADQGAPGSTFPEQPGANVQTACGSITTNPGTGGDRLVDIIPPETNALLTGLFTDACTFD